MRIPLRQECIRVLSASELVSALGGAARARVIKAGDPCDQEIRIVGVQGPFGYHREVAICTSDGFGELAAKNMI
jgi:hypothetical protein